MPVIVGYQGYVPPSGSNLTVSFNVQNPDSIILVFPCMQYAAVGEISFSINNVTIDGTSITRRKSLSGSSENRYIVHELWTARGVSPGTRTINVNLSNYVVDSRTIYVVEVAQLEGNPIAQIVDLNVHSKNVYKSVNTAYIDSLWIGCVRVSDGNNTLAPVGGATELLEMSTSSKQSGQVTGLYMKSGPGTYDFGAQSARSYSNSTMIGIELIGAIAPAVAEGAPALVAVPVYGTADLTPEAAVAMGEGMPPEILLGSVPATQVIWQGNAYLTTRAEVLSAMLLATGDDKWVLPTDAGAPEEFCVEISRRKAFLIPQ